MSSDYWERRLRVSYGLETQIVPNRVPLMLSFVGIAVPGRTCRQRVRRKGNLQIATNSMEVMPIPFSRAVHSGSAALLTFSVEIVPGTCPGRPIC